MTEDQKKTALQHARQMRPDHRQLVIDGLNKIVAGCKLAKGESANTWDDILSIFTEG